MSGAPDPTEPGQDRAGEYVLGLLRGAERRRFEAEMARDPSLAAEVAEWEERLLPLSLAVPEIEPPQSLWASIETAVIAESAPALARAPIQAKRPGLIAQIWDSVSLWRGFAVAAAAAAIALAVLRPGASPPPPAMVAVMQSKSGPMFTVAMRTDGGAMIAPVGHAAPPSGKVWQLWAVKKGAKPVAIGFLTSSGAVLPKGDVPAAFLKAHVLIAATVEPQGGSPTGQPTSAPVFAGPLLPMKTTSRQA